MITAQGGDPDAPLPVAPARRHEVRAGHSGVLSGLDAYAVGRRRVAPRRRPGPQGGHGPGRCRRRDPRQARGCGREGDLLLTLHTDTPERFERAQAALEGAVTIAPEGTDVPRTSIVLDRIA